MASISTFELLEVHLNPFQAVGEVSLLHLDGLLLDPEKKGGAVVLYILDFHDNNFNPLSTSGPSFHLGESVVVGCNICDHRFLIDGQEVKEDLSRRSSLPSLTPKTRLEKLIQVVIGARSGREIIIFF